MSNLSITEYRMLARDLNSSPLPAGQEPAVTHQNITFTTTAGQSDGMNNDTRFIRISADADCRILLGTDPTAGQTHTLMVAGQSEYFGVQPGGSTKLSVVEVL